MSWFKKLLTLIITIIQRSGIDQQRTVLVVRNEPVKWEVSDRENLYKFLNTITGRKWLLIVEDSIIQDVLIKPYDNVDVKSLNDYVAGKVAVLDFLKRHSLRGNNVNNPQNEEYDKDNMAPLPMEENK